MGIKNRTVDKGSEGPGLLTRMVGEVLGGSLPGGPIGGWSEILYFSRVVSGSSWTSEGVLGSLKAYLKVIWSSSYQKVASVSPPLELRNHLCDEMVSRMWDCVSYEAALEKALFFSCFFLENSLMGLSLPCKRTFDNPEATREREREREMEGDRGREKGGDAWGASALLTPSCWVFELKGQIQKQKYLQNDPSPSPHLTAVYERSPPPFPRTTQLNQQNHQIREPNKCLFFF